MKLHVGPLANPVRLITSVRGYRFKDFDAPERYIERPAEITRPLRRMFGFSIGKCFIGLMIWDQPKST